MIKPSLSYGRNDTILWDMPSTFAELCMISTMLAAKKETEPIVLPPEFSDFVDVFKKPEVPLPSH